MESATIGVTMYEASTHAESRHHCPRPWSCLMGESARLAWRFRAEHFCTIASFSLPDLRVNRPKLGCLSNSGLQYRLEAEKHWLRDVDLFQRHKAHRWYVVSALAWEIHNSVSKRELCQFLSNHIEEFRRKPEYKLLEVTTTDERWCFRCCCDLLSCCVSCSAVSRYCENDVDVRIWLCHDDCTIRIWIVP